MNMDTLLATKQNEAVKLTEGLTRSLVLEGLVPNIFDRGGFKLTAIRNASPNNKPPAGNAYVLLNGGVIITRVYITYKEGNKKESFSLSDYAKIEGGKFYPNNKATS